MVTMARPPECRFKRDSYSCETAAASAAAGYEFGFNFLPYRNPLPLLVPFHIGRFGVGMGTAKQELIVRVLREQTGEIIAKAGDAAGSIARRRVVVSEPLETQVVR
jgi:hypothetical protein